MNTSRGEKERLQTIRELLFIGNESFEVLDSLVELLPVGMDDAALIKISDDSSLVVCSDFVRGSEFYLFQLGHLNYFDIGYYLIAANLSDIAAMGADPLALTTIVRYQKDMTDNDFLQIFEGMKSSADFFNVKIIGGDTGSYSTGVLAATALGIIKTESVLLRKNVKNDDLLCVTGTIGLPITALIYWKKAKELGFSLSQQEEEEILNSWKRPLPRIQEGLILSKNKIANACQDISDGLKATVQQLSEASGKTFTIYADTLPINNTTRKIADFFNVDCVQIASSASVDFELLFTISPDKQSICTSLLEEFGCKCTIIGKVNSLDKNTLVNQSGTEVDLPGVVWDQQTGDFLADILR